MLNGILDDKQTTLIGLAMILVTILLLTRTVSLETVLPLLGGLNGAGFLLAGRRLP